MSSDILLDAREVTGFTLCVSLLYAGYDLYKIEVTDQNKQGVFTVLCPEEDFKIIREDYLAGRLSISDAQEFGKTYTRLTQILKNMRRDGTNTYINPDYVHLQRQMSRTR